LSKPGAHRPGEQEDERQHDEPDERARAAAGGDDLGEDLDGDADAEKAGITERRPPPW